MGRAGCIYAAKATLQRAASGSLDGRAIAVLWVWPHGRDATQSGAPLSSGSWNKTAARRGTRKDCRPSPCVADNTGGPSPCVIPLVWSQDEEPSPFVSGMPRSPGPRCQVDRGINHAPPHKGLAYTNHGNTLWSSAILHKKQHNEL